MEVVLRSGYHQPLLGYNNVDWFVNEVNKIENKVAFYFKKATKDIIMTKEDEEDFKNIKNCRFCEKHFECGKVRDHCHLTGNYRERAHSKFIINVSQD